MTWRTSPRAEVLENIACGEGDWGNEGAWTGLEELLGRRGKVVEGKCEILVEMGGVLTQKRAGGD